MSSSVNGSSFTHSHSFAEYSTTTSVESLGNDEQVVEHQVAEKEQKAVQKYQACVAIVLFLAAAAMSTTTYLLIKNEEKEDFETQFENYALQTIAVSHEHTRNTFSAIESFSTTISSYASNKEFTWPFVTVPDFAARSERLINHTHAKNVSIMNIVQQRQRQQWIDYSVAEAPAWYQNSIHYKELDVTVDDLLRSTYQDIWNYDPTTGASVPETKPGPWLVVWQSYLFQREDKNIVNFNSLNDRRTENSFFTTSATLGPTLDFRVTEDVGQSEVIYPIFEEVDDGVGEKIIVGVVSVALDWLLYFQNVLPETAKGVVVVLTSSCEEDSITYEITGENAIVLGKGDLHDTKYNHLGLEETFVSFDVDETKVPYDKCSAELAIEIYPSKDLEACFITKDAMRYTIMVVAIFLFTTIVFFIYDYSVRLRQKTIMERVERQEKIVLDMFPSKIRDRLYGIDDKDKTSYEDGEEGGETRLADLFPCVTVIFADIVGFTAWSSAREPPQVFKLLEKIFGAFDQLSYRHDVFKVETVGDCYVAVAGLPEPRKDHALVAAKFARDILHKMKDLTVMLEMTLGPDTTDLDLRIGIHSGQVTAGVLRGKRSRFQLFGDTVNTAARMESTSKGSCIHVSEDTAKLLRQSGRSKWLEARNETIFVRGKGEVQTYWLETKSQSVARSKILTSIDEDNGVESAPDLISSQFVIESPNLTKTERLVEWNVDVLGRLLQQILAARESASVQALVATEKNIGQGSTVLEEFIPIITLPKIQAEDLRKRKDPMSIDLGNAVKMQLRGFLKEVAGMYRDNPFHNFEHASHVTASVRKLLTRIVKVDDANGLSAECSEVELVDVAGHSYGITSDPLTQFAVVFSAVIHDLDHPGVPNAQLVKEKTRNATIYKEKSVAEQNSVDLAWELLMLPDYVDLRKCIYSNEDELKRFRQLVVNVVMATDICDKELQALRKARWETAFSRGEDSDPELEIDRKATIVIEHLIQASDVSHTMQHWEIYKQWNERFFMECYGAYTSGRADSDPSINWYKGEIGFFDFYIIPLAKKLENCGVFGVSSHEYLNYAKANRASWEREGEQIVEGYLNAFSEKQNNYKASENETELI